MQKITMSQAKAGMILAYDVTTAKDKVLAPAGTSLDDATLRRLEYAGVMKLVVKGKPVAGADMGYDAHTRAERVQHLFRKHENDSFMVALRNMLFKHFKVRA